MGQTSTGCIHRSCRAWWNVGWLDRVQLDGSRGNGKYGYKKHKREGRRNGGGVFDHSCSEQARALKMGRNGPTRVVDLTSSTASSLTGSCTGQSPSV
jgi:hypothetical protein